MASVNVDKLSLKELLDLEGKLERAIVAARDREHGELKQDLAAFAEKRGFSLKELFGGRGKGKTSVAKYANPDDRSDVDRSWPQAKLADCQGQEGREA